MAIDENDPKGLIREAFRIDGISTGECRTIFLDWALGVPTDVDMRAVVRKLITQYQEVAADHPMMATLHAALSDAAPARRRGGRQGRLADQ